MDREEQLRREQDLILLAKERSELATQFALDKHSVLALHIELHSGVRPLSEGWLQGGIELLLRLHEASARLVELDAKLSSYRKL